MIKILLSGLLGERRWTQADLARKTGIRPTTICDMYNGLTKRINLKHLDLICEALECEPGDLLTRGATAFTIRPTVEGGIVNYALKNEIRRGIDGLTAGEAKLLMSFIHFLKENRLPLQDRTVQATGTAQQPVVVGGADFAKQMEATSRKLLGAQ